MKTYKKYNQIPEKYRFDLECLLENDSLENLIKQNLNLKKELAAQKDSKFANKETFLNYLKKNEELSILNNRLENYICNKLAINVVDADMSFIAESLNIQNQIIDNEVGSEVHRLIANEEKIKSWMQEDERFAIYQKSFNKLFELKKHILNKDIEEYIINTAKADVDTFDFFNLFLSSEVDYGYALDSKKKKHKITEIKLIKLLENKDETLRKNVYKQYWSVLYKHRETLSWALISNFIKKVVVSQSRKYDSTVNSMLKSDELNTEFLQVLYENVQKYKSLVNKFNKSYKKFFKLKYKTNFKPWDSQLKLTKLNKKYTIEQAQELILNALKPMGNKYLKIVKKAFNENWIDYHNAENKEMGAYSIDGTYGLKKIYIFMNYDYQFVSVETLIHELGHSLHSYFTNENQPQELSDYPIILAEIASIFNELLLHEYVLKNSKNDHEKLFFLEKIISSFISTVFKQIEYSNFEYDLYNAIEKNETIANFKDLKKIYVNNYKKYCANPKTTKIDKPSNKSIVNFLTIPHFYNSFYVYKYAVGYIAANAFFNQYQKSGLTAIENYINKFLSVGDKNWPLITLKEAGIDLYDKTIYDACYDKLATLINEFIITGNKIFSKK